MAYRLPTSIAALFVTRQQSTDQMAPAAAGLNLNGQRIYDLATPLANTDAASLLTVMAPAVVTTNAPGATPSINVNTTYTANFTGMAANVTSMTSGLSGTPTDKQRLIICFTGTSTFNVTWGTSFESGATNTLPTTGAITTTLSTLGFLYNAATSKWRLVGIG